MPRRFAQLRSLWSAGWPVLGLLGVLSWAITMSAPGQGGFAPALLAALLLLALAGTLSVVRLQQAPRPVRVRTEAAAPLRRQGDPDAAGHIRPRAPGPGCS
jgi:hypothetical protein